MRRRGVMLVAVLVCLLVVSVLALQLTRTVIMQRRQIQVHQHRLQSLWLAESAVGRAAARLREEPEYRGETWRIAAKELTGDRDAVAEIKVEAIESEPAQRRIIVEAFYPDNKKNRVLTRKTVFIELQTQGDSR